MLLQLAIAAELRQDLELALDFVLEFSAMDVFGSQVPPPIALVAKETDL
jgi:hypothetical protein